MPDRSQISVRVAPGSTACTRTPCGSSWLGQRLAEVQQIGLGAAIDAVEHLREQREHRGDVDDPAALARGERLACSSGEQGRRGDIERDQLLDLAHLAVEQAAS